MSPSRSTVSAGFTLIELMIVVALIAVLAAIALPLYQGYIQTSREGVLVHNIATIEVFQEDYRLRTGSYLTAAADLAAIEAAINWEPRTDIGTTYVIEAGDAADSYEVTATDSEGTQVCMILPAKSRCD